MTLSLPETCQSTKRPIALLPAFTKSRREIAMKNTAKKRNSYVYWIVLDLFCIIMLLFFPSLSVQKLISPLALPLSPLTESKKGYEVFGFAPYWTFEKLHNVDFSTLTTFAYFGVEVDGNGNLDKEGVGYQTFRSDSATEIFKKAHAHNTRVVLTLTQMDNEPIKQLMDDLAAQENTIEQAVTEVKNRGIDGINVDFEYTGNPGIAYRDKFSNFVAKLTQRMHAEIPQSKVTVSVYASAVKDPKIYDIARLGQEADGVFMMAYDFAVAGADNAMPTAPLGGHKQGRYWYDIETAVSDFLTLMPSHKLILGVPYYGYNYLVYKPGIKAETRPWYSWRGKPTAQTYSIVQDNVKAEKTGWDEHGQVGWKAYYVDETDTWRMVFVDDVRSLAVKYDFAKDKGLGGVGMWALGFDDGKHELWALLAQKFGIKLAKSDIAKSK